MKKYMTVIFICIFAGIILLTGCTRDRSKGIKDAKDPVDVIVVLDWSVNTNHTGLYVALEKGYFAEEGLNVQIEFPPETGADSLVVAGTAQFSVSYQEAVTYARAAGTPLKAVAAIIQHNTSGFASRTSEGIHSPKDFEGKYYGGWGMPVEEAVIESLMKKEGGDYSKVEVISIGSMDFFAATSGDIDFVWVFEGWDVAAANLKNIEIDYFPLGEIEPALDYYTPVLAAKDSYILDNPETVKHFLAAVSRGYSFCVNQPDESAEILMKYAPELDRDLVMASQRFLAEQYIADATRWGQMKHSVWSDFAEWLDSYGLLEGEFQPSEAFTNEYLPK